MFRETYIYYTWIKMGLRRTSIRTSERKSEKLRKRFRRMAALAAGFALFVGLWAGAVRADAAEPGTSVAGQAAEALQKLQDRLAGSPADDWTAFALARAGRSLPAAFLMRFERDLTEERLRRATDYARAVLVADAAGLNVRQAGPRQIDLPAALANYPALAEEGVHAAAFALMALDAAGYGASPSDAWTRSKLIRLLLDRRAPEGGWAHAPGGSDVEVTAIVLNALAPYYELNPEVRRAADGALKWLSSVQLANGGFGRPESAEAAAQVVLALASLGIDPASDPRFVKAGQSVLGRLLEFQLADGTFMHRQGGSSDSLASVHALLALTAYDRFRDGLSGLYRGSGGAEPVKVVVHSPGGVLAQGYGTGRTVLDAVAHVLKAGNVPYRMARDPLTGHVLEVAGDYENRSGSATDRWQFVITREGQREWNVTGIAGLDLAGIREIVAYYGKPPVLVRSVKWSPLTPREGLPLTVTVETETYNPFDSRVSVGPAAGVTITAGPARAVTNAQGQAVLEGLKAGTSTLRVEGPSSPGAAGYTAFERTLNVDTYIKDVVVRIEGDQGLVGQGEARGGTALEALEHFLKSRGISHELKSGKDGTEIAVIYGIGAGRYGAGDGWRLAAYREGRLVSHGEDPGRFLPEDGMELVFYYGTAHTRIPAEVAILPARPKAGEPVTVIVAYREWEEARGGYGPAKALEGAQVTAAGVSAVTGPSGRAVLTGLPEGVHTIEIAGYAPDQAPAVLRTVRQVAVAGAYPDEEQIAPWAKDWVHDAKAYGVLLGEGDAADMPFQPKRAVTRAEFVTALVRALGIRPAEDFLMFEDVAPDAWYAREVAAAVKAGLVYGTSPGRFSPDAPITREQAAVLLVRALKLKEQPQGELPADAGAIAAYARTAVQTVMAQGWMTAQADGRFQPKDLVTREQAAIIAVRVLNREGIGKAP